MAKKKKKLHWTQRPENKARLKKQLAKMNKVRNGGIAYQETTSNEKTANEVSQEVEMPKVSRASERSCIFVDNNRVYVRNLCDVTLINESNKLSIKLYEMRLSIETLENLNYQMHREKEYRRL